MAPQGWEIYTERHSLALCEQGASQLDTHIELSAYNFGYSAKAKMQELKRSLRSKRVAGWLAWRSGNGLPSGGSEYCLDGGHGIH
jgi:hypothetical protein